MGYKLVGADLRIMLERGVLATRSPEALLLRMLPELRLTCTQQAEVSRHSMLVQHVHSTSAHDPVRHMRVSMLGTWMHIDAHLDVQHASKCSLRSAAIRRWSQMCT